MLFQWSSLGWPAAGPHWKLECSATGPHWEFERPSRVRKSRFGVPVVAVLPRASVRVAFDRAGCRLGVPAVSTAKGRFAYGPLGASVWMRPADTWYNNKNISLDDLVHRAAVDPGMAGFFAIVSLVCWFAGKLASWLVAWLVASAVGWFTASGQRRHNGRDVQT